MLRIGTVEGVSSRMGTDGVREVCGVVVDGETEWSGAEVADGLVFGSRRVCG